MLSLTDAVSLGQYYEPRITTGRNLRWVRVTSLEFRDAKNILGVSWFKYKNNEWAILHVFRDFVKDLGIITEKSVLSLKFLMIEWKVSVLFD